ncbi:hypothetical protein TNCV_848471 [Trichonephila clavipes]|uniref:Uncharacterized protein n=1 Tax=Trichonephila clavipes TaxID=2585209 RepID=A0A8X6RPK8_TRICX|nr:hypothetical protein TNCV_848471 [Trichonephila clavipes]
MHTCHIQTGIVTWRNILSFTSHDPKIREPGIENLTLAAATSSSPVPLKTRRVGQRCTLNLSRAQTFSRWCGVVGGASSGVDHVT